MDAVTSSSQSQAAAQPPRKAAFALLLVGALAAGMGQTIVFSVLPPLARDVGLSDLQTGIIFAVSACFWVFCGPLWGRASDKRGRKPFILLGLVGFAFSMILFAMSLQVGLLGTVAGAPLWLLLILSRSLYGFLGSAGPPAAQAYIADRTSKAQRTAGMAGFAAAFGLGAMLGPGFGAAAAVMGPIAPFYAMAVLTGVMAIAVFLFLPENRAPTEKPAPPKLRLTDPRLRPFLIFGLIFGVINSIPMQTIGFYFIDRLGFSTDLAPQFVGVGLMGGAMASLFSQLVIVQRFGLSPGMLMRVAPGLVIVGHTLIWATADLGTVVFGMVIAGFGSGLAIPGFNAAASLAVSAEEQGSAIGLANAAGASGFIVAPFIGMTLYGVAPQIPYMFTSVLAFLIGGYALMSRAIRDARAGAPEAPDERPASAPYR